MTPQEYRDAINGLTPKIGLKAEIYTSFNNEGKFFHAAIYPQGIVGSSRGEDGYLRVEGDTFADLFENLTAGWTEYEKRHRTQIIRKMALAIIQVTADLGECTDAALRQQFDVGQIAAYGDDACREANEIAGKGPFKIKKRRGANNLEVA